MWIYQFGLKMKSLNQSHVDLEPIGDKGQSSGSSKLCDDAEKLGAGNERASETSVLECPVEVDLEAGVHLPKREGECGICRICQMSYDATFQELGAPLELGCSCKGDLAAAHKQCAEAWFKIRGNKTCEICGSTAGNVTCTYPVDSEQPPLNEATRVPRPAIAVLPPAMSHNFWEDHRLLNILLAVMVFAFVISWLFHFKAPSL